MDFTNSFHSSKQSLFVKSSQSVFVEDNFWKNVFICIAIEFNNPNRYCFNNITLGGYNVKSFTTFIKIKIKLSSNLSHLIPKILFSTRHL